MRRFVLAGSVLRPDLIVVRLRIVFVFASCILILLPLASAQAERVGFAFTGTMVNGSTSTKPLFGAVVAAGSPVTGTFSYDSDTQGVDGGAGVQTYHQLIHGGYTMNIGNKIQLAADDYNLTIMNDSGSPPFDSLIVGYLYDATVPITPPQLSVNGAPWTGQMSEIYLREQWDAATFPDASLTPDRPIAPGATLPDSQCFCADVRSSPAAKFFSITSITTIPLIAGDYNRDGKLDRNDYFEWQEAFNHAESHYAYADGNNDGVVDAADYTVWRDGTSVGGTGAAAALSVPEPATVLLAALGTALITGVFRYDPKHRF